MASRPLPTPAERKLLIKDFIRSQDSLGNTTLHNILKRENETVAKALVFGKADVNARNNEGSTPLHTIALYARTSAGTDLTSFLIFHGAEINAQNKYGCTPLHYAVNKSNISVIITLLNAGAGVNIQDIGGSTPLHFLLGQLNCGTIETEQIFSRVLAPKFRVNLNLKNCDGNTLLHVAASCSSEKIFFMLLKAGAVVNIKNNQNATPLHLVIKSKKSPDLAAALVKKILKPKYAADFNAKDVHGNTPLHLATMAMNKDIIKSLLKAGANVNLRNDHDDAPIHYLVNNTEHQELAADLLNEILLPRYGTDVNVKNKDGNTPLHLAAVRLNKHIFKHLLEHGADVNLRNKYDETPLLLLAENKRDRELAFELASELLSPKYRVNVNVVNGDGDTALHLAALIKNNKMYKLLKQRGACVRIKNKTQDTPVDYYKSDTSEESSDENEQAVENSDS